MKLLIILSGLLAVVCARKSCSSETIAFCSDKVVDLSHCGAKYGHTDHIKRDLQNYVNLHFSSSFKYLQMMTNFGGYVKNREGMEKVFRHLSDHTWNDAIDLIKYMNKRGIDVKWDEQNEEKQFKPLALSSYNVNEIEGLAHALDSQKQIAEEAIKIHSRASENAGTYDPEVASFLENNFLHKHADVIRNLAGLTNDLRAFTDSSDVNTVSAFLFDEYLKKIM